MSELHVWSQTGTESIASERKSIESVLEHTDKKSHRIAYSQRMLEELLKPNVSARLP